MYFNPRSREGSDQCGSDNRQQYRYFNPRSREGSDSPDVGLRPASSDFNPRSREGSDVIRAFQPHRGVLFQSALPRGERRSAYFFAAVFVVFQSALPRGERLCSFLHSVIHGRFQSALPRGERLLQALAPSPLQDFNPRSREGSDNNFHQKVLFSLSKNCLIHLFFITNFLN